MQKRYKLIDSVLHYWETFDEDKITAIVHWGIVGEKGQAKSFSHRDFSKVKAKIQNEYKQLLREGYMPIDEDDLKTLSIEFEVDGFGDNQDLEKRHLLEDKLDALLAWTGLGHVDGGSIGSGTMEVCCLVVDFDIAKGTIAKSLENTEFNNFTRIVDQTLYE
jgi:hypothetical protein